MRDRVCVARKDHGRIDLGVGLVYERGCAMSMRPRALPEVPEQTVLVARAAFRRGTLAMRVRDELGEVFGDGAFVDAFGIRGRPGISPGQLAMVTVLQFAENLTDRQAADAVRGRIDWKYCLGLELTDDGFDFTVLSQFRTRLVGHALQSMAFDMLLDRLVEAGLLKPRGRQRTDATHVLAGVRDLNRLEMVGETLRAALEALAAAAPTWLAGHVEAEQVQRYAARIDEWRLPGTQTKRRQLGAQIGVDGWRLLQAVIEATAPDWLRQIPAVDILRRVWIQQYTRDQHSGEVTWRDADTHGLPPGRTMLVSPYDPDARHSQKRGRGWSGYKVHLSETCDNTVDGDGDQPPNLITNVVTTHAAVADSTMTMPIHHQLAEKDLLPGEHAMDAGYASAPHILACRTDHDVRLITPVRDDHSHQARAKTGFDRDAFAIDFDRQQATCPQGAVSTMWNPARYGGEDVVVVTFPASTCIPCPVRSLCTHSAQRRRQLTLRPRPLHDALQHARAEQTTDDWKARYRIRAGIEATISQAVVLTGIRRARYTGIGKVHLEHLFAATAINLIRLDAWWTGTPLQRTRTTHLARLDLALAA
jgi:transposase